MVINSLPFPLELLKSGMQKILQWESLMHRESKEEMKEKTMTSQIYIIASLDRARYQTLMLVSRKCVHNCGRELRRCCLLWEEARRQGRMRYWRRYTNIIGKPYRLIDIRDVMIHVLMFWYNWSLSIIQWLFCQSEVGENTDDTNIDTWNHYTRLRGLR